MKFLRGSPYIGHDGVVRCEIAGSNGYDTRTVVYVFTDAQQVLDFATKLQLVGEAWLVESNAKRGVKA
jgi:hypothetical protein